MSFTPSLSDITPGPTGSPSGSNDSNSSSGGGGRSLNNNGSPSLASSASLYRTSPQFTHSPHIIFSPRDQETPLTSRPFNEIAVYTFLATLVLLLSVSAAIVIRSFLLRRRHRRMIEEAIRNGTWVPPTPNGRTGPKVDLSKKPPLWEAYLNLHHHPQQQHIPIPTSDERDWDSMKPIMATYINDSSARKAPTSLTGGVAGGTAIGGGVGGIGQADTGGDRVSSARHLLQQFTNRMRSAISRNPFPPQFGTSSSNTGTEIHSRQASDNNTSGQHDPVPMTELAPPTPSKVRVAVLIAMPRPHNSSSSSTSRSASTSSSPQIPFNAATTRSNQMNAPDEEEDLPHIEMGVAELVVVNASLSTSMDLGRSSLGHGQPTAKGKMRESMMSYGSS